MPQRLHSVEPPDPLMGVAREEEGKSPTNESAAGPRGSRSRAPSSTHRSRRTRGQKNLPAGSARRPTVLPHRPRHERDPCGRRRRPRRQRCSARRPRTATERHATLEPDFDLEPPLLVYKGAPPVSRAHARLVSEVRASSPIVCLRSQCGEERMRPARGAPSARGCVPFSCPPAPSNGAVEPKHSGIIIRVSGVRVPPPAWEVPANGWFLRWQDIAMSFRVSLLRAGELRAVP